MAQLKYVYSVEELNGPAMASLGALHLGDRYGNVIQLDITRDGEPVDLTAGIITGTAIRADGGTITLSGTLASGYTNKCNVGLPAQCYTVPGPLQVYIRWEGDNIKTTYFAGIGDVVSTDTGVIGDTTVPTTVASLIAAINAATASLPADYSSLWATLAPAYSTSVSYVPGQFVTYNGTLYVCKSDTSGAWSSSAWSAVVLTDMAVTQMGSRDGVDDFDDMLPNKVYTLVSDIDHPPSAVSLASIGTALTMNGDTFYGNGQAQILVTKNNEVYSRIKWNDVWLPWQTVNNDMWSGISMFPRFGVVGDSYASGVIFVRDEEQTETASDHHYQLSWPQVLARENGVTACNYARGGMTTKSFITNTTYGLTKLERDIEDGSPCGLYLLCLGINDSNAENDWGGLDDLGDENDIDASNPDNNADTFWGNYSRIIAHIQAAAPDAKIALCTFKRIPTSATSAGYVPFNNAIRELAEYWSLPLLDLENDSFFASPYYLNGMVGVHPTAPQYVGYAHGINRLLCKAIRENYSYFSDFIDFGNNGSTKWDNDQSTVSDHTLIIS